MEKRQKSSDLELLEKSLKHFSFVMKYIKAPWFVCFGTLLGLVRDNGLIKGDKDIDIGMFYEDLIGPKGDTYLRLIKGFEKIGYKLGGIITTDVMPFVPLNMYFNHKDLPTIDVFAWVKDGDIRYHTYDTKQERKKIPSEYVLKGVKDVWLKDIERIRFPFMKIDVNIPRKYGTLLDEWYPNWKIPAKGVSKTRWEKKTKTLKKILL